MQLLSETSLYIREEGEVAKIKPNVCRRPRRINKYINNLRSSAK